MKEVVIATPSGDMAHMVFTVSLCGMVAHTMSHARKDLGTSFLNINTSMLSASRQWLASRALEEHNASHILWIDSDMEFPSDMLLRLVEHDVDIVGANCRVRRPPYEFTAQKDKKHIETHAESRGLERVERVGFGVLMVKTEVFRKLKKPWFDYQWIEEHEIFRGEDYVFCDRAVEAGFKIYIDHDLSKQIKHTGIYGFSPLTKITT